MLENRFKFNLLISSLIFFIFLKHLFFLPLYRAKWSENTTPKRFKIEFKDRNITYFYYGYGRHSCGESNLLIATLSRPDAKNLRKNVRNSWAKFLPPNVTHKFFIGDVQNDIALKESLYQESNRHADIIFTDLIDSYLNLTIKMNAVFQWQQFYCPKVEFFLRADEDTVLDVMRFKYWLDKSFSVISEELNDMVIFGHVDHDYPVLRNPHDKWYVSFEEYNQTIYPDFMIGASYLVPTKAIKAILEEAKNHKHMSIDDGLYTGIIPEAIGIKRIDSQKHFAEGNPLIRANSSYECDETGVPFLFSIYDDGGEIETTPGGYNEALKKLKQLHC